MSLYKYVTPDRIDILQNAHIRFTRVDDFNDPFEGNPAGDDVVNEQAFKIFSDWMYGTRNIIISKGETDDIFGYLMRRVPSLDKGSRYEAPSKKIFKPNAYERSFQPWRTDEIGILSLTEKRDNLLMWSHYAHNHGGFVIEFDEKHEFFNQRDDTSEDFDCLRKVEYAGKRPRGFAFLDLGVKEKYLVKGKDWEYEQEWRMLRQLDAADYVINAESSPIHLFSLPPLCVTGIIFGCRMSDENKSELLKLLTNDERYSHINKFQACMDSQKYGLQILPIDGI